ncbi:MAG: DHA2 family efflux MFS transporter permease subunit [Sphingorhabdus sp.]
MASAALPASAAAPPPPPPPPADIAALPVAQRGLLTIGIMAAMVMQILDTTIANVALPHMQTSLGATIDTVTWVLTSYIIAAAIATPLTGWLSERFGSRNLCLFAVGGFIVASMLCGIATNLNEMVVFRLFQGMCGAFIGPLSQTAMLDINPPSKQGRAMSWWGMGVMVGPIMGPIVGGWLTESYNWRWCFYVNLPIGIMTFAILWALLPSRGKTQRSFDYFGFSMIALALASLQLMLDRGQQQDWFQSWEIILYCAITISCFWAGIVHLVTGKNPLFDRVLFKNRNLVTAMGFMIVVGMTTMAPMALLPPMLQNLFGYPVIDTGMVLAPRGVGVLVTMAISGRLRDRVDMRYLIAIGSMISAYSLWMMAHWSLDLDMRHVVFAGFIQGLGMGLVFMPLNAMAFATLDQRWRTDGASLLNLLRSIGASVGISICTTLLAQSLQTSHEYLSANITRSAFSAIDPAQATRFGAVGGAALTAIDGEINRQAAMIAYLNNFYLMAIITVITLPLIFLLKKPVGPIEVVHAGE